MNLTSESIDRAPPHGSDGLTAYCALACAVTWALAMPAAVAWRHREAPSPIAVGCIGLSAFGPLFAALAIAGPRRELGRVFGRWRTNPAWIALALVAPAAVHVTAAALFAAIGGHVGAWLHLPATSEQVAALVVFPLGEEFGWRGFAYPRMVDRYGPVKGALILGLVWGLWHLAYGVSPASGAFDLREFGTGLIELPMYSLLIAWAFERSNRSMAVAIAFHAGAHLDHLERAPDVALGRHALHMVVLAALAIVAARSLARGASPSPGRRQSAGLPRPPPNAQQTTLRRSSGRADH